MTSSHDFPEVHRRHSSTFCAAVATLLIVSAVVLASALTPPRAHAQPVFADSSYIVVDGTSNRSDWTVHAPEFSASVATSDSGVPVSAILTVNALAMESRKSTIMDRLMLKAMKTDAHDTITFASTDITGADNGRYIVAGELELAGTKQPVTVNATRSMNETGQVVWVGSVPLEMTNFGIKPPTAMFGALHTGDEVTVRFRLVEE